MIVPKRRRIFLKSKAAGNPEDGAHNSMIVVFEYIPLPNLLAVLVFQTRILADGGGINFMDAAGIIHDLNTAIAFPIVKDDKRSINPFFIFEAFASEFNLSHFSSVNPAPFQWARE